MTKNVESSSGKVTIVSTSVNTLLLKVKNTASLVSLRHKTTTTTSNIPLSNEYLREISTNRSIDNCNDNDKHDDIQSSLTTKACCCSHDSDTSLAITQDLLTITRVYDILLQEPRRRKTCSRIWYDETEKKGSTFQVKQTLALLSKKRTSSSFHHDEL
jgi:hypothetical protein